MRIGFKLTRQIWPVYSRRSLVFGRFQGKSEHVASNERWSRWNLKACGDLDYRMSEALYSCKVATFRFSASAASNESSSCLILLCCNDLKCRCNTASTYGWIRDKAAILCKERKGASGLNSKRCARFCSCLFWRLEAWQQDCFLRSDRQQSKGVLQTAQEGKWRGPQVIYQDTIVPLFCQACIDQYVCIKYV